CACARPLDLSVCRDFLAAQIRSDAPGDFRLRGKDGIDFLLVRAGPDSKPGTRTGNLDQNPDTLPLSAYASLQHIVRVQFGSDIPDVAGTVAKLKGRCSRHEFQSMYAAQCRRDLICKALGKRAKTRACFQTDQRQDDQRNGFAALLRCSCSRMQGG